MLVVTRYVVPIADAQSFLDRARVAVAAFAGCAGCRAGWVGRSTDDPTLWTLTLEWDRVGDYRRALSSPQVKVSAVPLMYQALDEPSAFEVLATLDAVADGGTRPRETHRAADAGTVAVGEASAPAVPRDVH